MLHNAELDEKDRRQVALINCGPRAVLTSFTASAVCGLAGWERPEIHVLAPAGTRRPDIAGLVLHRSGDWARVQRHPLRRLHSLAPALVIAASSFVNPKYHLPLPSRQGVRTEPDGRRRYLDAEWRLRNGRRVAVEVDGAVHLTPQRWYDDQLRQNDVVIGGTVMLRYPSVVVRVDEPVVARQLAQILL